MATDQPLHGTEPSSDNKPNFTVTCHCGRVRVQMLSKPEWLNDCHCTICYAYGTLWAYFKRGEVVVMTASDTTLQAYIRADSDGDISFNRCGHCGCVVSWLGEGEWAGPEHQM
jgi:hypothetical protein